MEDKIIESKNIYFHLPYGKLDKYLDFFIKEKLNPEIYFDAEDIDTIKLEKIKELSGLFKTNSMQVIMHAPFRDLNLGSGDSKIRDAATERILSAIDLAVILNANTIVIHSGFDQIYNDKIKAKWMGHAKETLKNILEKAQETGIAVLVENAIENNIDVIVEFIKTQDNKNVKMCLDIAHFNVFCKGDVCGFIRDNYEFIGEFHVSDNMGDIDSHLPLGKGNIDWHSVFKCINDLNINANITVETHHGVEDIKMSLTSLSSFTSLTS